MREVLRKASAWLLVLSLADGLVLPLLAKPVAADPDGACGRVLVPAHAVQHFEAPLPAESDHCVLCHLWNAIASSSISQFATFDPPNGAITDVRPQPVDSFQFQQFEAAVPRGPPALA